MVGLGSGKKMMGNASSFIGRHCPGSREHLGSGSIFRVRFEGKLSNGVFFICTYLYIYYIHIAFAGMLKSSLSSVAQYVLAFPVSLS